MAEIIGTAIGETLDGTNVADIIRGLGGDDIINGAEGDDTLEGDDGADTFTGGTGNDFINGGFGDADVVVYAGNRADYLIESIVINGLNQIRVSGLGAFAQDGVDTLFNVEAIQFANVRVSLGISSNTRPEFGLPAMADQVANDSAPFSYQVPATAFFDQDLDDVLTFRATMADGAALPVWLSFNAATRTFSGTPPVSLIGEVYNVRVYASDNDLYDPNSEISDDFTITINQAPGADIVATQVGDTLFGTFRNETMIGGAGNDVFFGSAGADRIDGGVSSPPGGDIVNYSTSRSAVTVNLGTGIASGGDAEGDLLISIEGVVGSAFADVLTSTDGFDVLWGGLGDDTINAGGGDDVVYGEGGNDNISGGANNDRLSGGAGSDQVDGGVGADILFSGESFADFRTVLDRYLLADIILDRGAEPDTLIGGDNDDVLFVGWNDNADGGASNADGDTLYVSLQGATAGVQIDFTLPSITLGSGTITGFENVQFVEGSNFDDVITMRSVGQTLPIGQFPSLQRGTVHGMGGNDILISDLWTSYMHGDEGNDILDGRFSQILRLISGGAGNDEIFLQTRPGNSNSVTTVEGGEGVDRLIITGQNIYINGLSGIEGVELRSNGLLTLTGSEFANGLAFNSSVEGTGTIRVNMEPDVIFFSNRFTFIGAGVSMEVRGTNATDVIKSGHAPHLIFAGDGADQIRGGNGVDTIFGEGGDDKIWGTGGADILTGGLGRDQFRYFSVNDSAIGNADRITDFAIGQDRLIFVQIDTDTLAAGDQAFAFIGTAAFGATGAAQIRYRTLNNDLVVEADINGDGVADMEVILQNIGSQTLTAADFVL